MPRKNAEKRGSEGGWASVVGVWLCEACAIDSGIEMLRGCLVSRSASKEGSVCERVAP